MPNGQLKLAQNPRLGFVGGLSAVALDARVARIDAADIDAHLRRASARALLDEGDLAATREVEQRGHEREAHGRPADMRRDGWRHSFRRRREQDRWVVDRRCASTAHVPHERHRTDHKREPSESPEDEAIHWAQVIGGEARLRPVRRP